jgi:hypothetical protein
MVIINGSRKMIIIASHIGQELATESMNQGMLGEQ